MRSKSPSTHPAPQRTRAPGTYLLPVNADPNKPEINGYPVDTLYANLAKLRARSVTVYLDACFSGDSPKGMLIQATSGITVTPTLPKKSGNMMILTAANGTQVASWDRKAEHGLFTEHLLTALYGAADAPRYGKADGKVTVGEAETYLKRHMTYAAKRTYGRLQDATVKGAPETVLSAPGDRPRQRPRASVPQTASLTPPSFTVEEVDETYVARKPANVRLLPTTRADKVGRLPAGTSVEVTGKAEVKGRPWWRVALSGGETGYVWGPLLGPQVAAVTPPRITTPSPAEPAVGVYPKAYKPGDTFRDCGDCPEMVVIPPGRFRMGDLSGDGDDDEKPVHDVRIDYSFAVGKYEVTQDEWVSVMGSNPSAFKGGRNPVENVSWDDVRAFVDKLSRKTGKEYRLLSESEWEYVARAGSTTKFSWGNTASHEYANYGKDECCAGLAQGRDRWVNTSPSGSFLANSFGVYDMHGNVWEWVEDCWHDSYQGASSDGSAWVSGVDCGRRVLRGGSWRFLPRYLRSANRSWNSTDDRFSGFGFRVARTVSR